MKIISSLALGVIAMSSAPLLAQTAPPAEVAPPVQAQPSPAPDAAPVPPTPAEMVAEPAAPTPPASALTPEQKAAYAAWPENVRTYFDGLSPSRQTLFLRIADADKIKLAGMDPAQQETSWASIEKQDAQQKGGGDPSTPPG